MRTLTTKNCRLSYIILGNFHQIHLEILNTMVDFNAEKELCKNIFTSSSNCLEKFSLVCLFADIYSSSLLEYPFLEICIKLECYRSSFCIFRKQKTKFIIKFITFNGLEHDIHIYKTKFYNTETIHFTFLLSKKFDERKIIPR